MQPMIVVSEAITTLP